VFEVFARRLPRGRRFGVVGGTGRLLGLLRDLTFDDADGTLQWLVDSGTVSPQTAQWLANYRFRGEITGYAEGETYFPGSPVLTVEGSFAECVILETLVLSVLNHDSAVASAAARMVMAANGRACLEMGARRTHEDAGVAAARAAYVAGFAGTSVLEAGRAWGIPTIGTAAHAFTLLHDDERSAFAAQVAAQGVGTTLLLDTYDVSEALRTAVQVAGPQLGAVRIDSGDLTALAYRVRSELDALGATGTKIVVTSDLDEYAIAALAVAPVDSYGVGTRLVTGSGAPTAEMVYKLVARANSAGVLEPVAKTVGGKSTLGGGKWAGRRIDDAGRALEEVVVRGSGSAVAAPEDYGLRPLQVTYARGGEIDSAYLGAAGVNRARDHHQGAAAELPIQARRLSDGEPAIPTIVTSSRASAGA
jgi:nicotinate phosphoribosyltransferase